MLHGMAAPHESLPDVDADIARAEGLPTHCFTSHDWLDLELRTIFANEWLLLPDADGGDLRVRGARAPASLLGRPLFLQRGWDDDALRLFPNTCTHAWFPLVTGTSRSPSLTCAQHGRKFDCRGRFVSQPGFGADTDQLGLTPLPVAEWNGLLFGALVPPRSPLSAALPALPSFRNGLQRDRSAASVREVDGNWKLHAINYMDSFHVTFIHRAPGGLADRIDMGSYRTELLDDGRTSLQWAYAKDPAHGFDPALLPERFADPAGPAGNAGNAGKGRRVFALWWFVFPCLAINAYPWGVSINAWHPVPGRPERTLFAWEHLVADDALHARRDEVWLSAQVDAEDIDAMSQVRRGLLSGFAPRTRFAPGQERGPHWLHRLVAEGVKRSDRSPRA